MHIVARGKVGPRPLVDEQIDVLSTECRRDLFLTRSTFDDIYIYITNIHTKWKSKGAALVFF